MYATEVLYYSSVASGWPRQLATEAHHSKTKMLLVAAALLFTPSAQVMRTRQHFSSLNSVQEGERLTAESLSSFCVVANNAPATKKRKGGATESLSTMPPLLDIGKLVRGTLIKRPSSTIRSPYVADVSLNRKGSDEVIALAHAPALDVGGLCVAGSEVYLSVRSGEGKTSHAIELVRGAPLTNEASDKGVLVGAHPRLGELIAQEVLKRGLLKDELILENGLELGLVDDDKIHLKQQVTIGDSRVDFQLTLSDNHSSHKVIAEVKNVVCADYKSGTEPKKRDANHCVIVAHTSSSGEDYHRSALFPWGRKGQKFEGKPVVSERAIKHLRNLQSLKSNDVTAVVMFIVNRSDCESIRACGEQCPVFQEVLREALQSGVKAVGVRVRWVDDGKCFFDGFVPVKA